LNNKKEQKALTLYEKGLKAVEANKAPNAIKYYREAINLKPDFYQAHNNLGNLYQAKRNFEAALSSFKAALAITGDNAIILNNIGNNYRLQGSVDTALTYFRKAVFKDPTYVSAQLNLGIALFDIGEKESAIEAFESAKSKGVSSLLINLMLLQSKNIAPDSQVYLMAANDLYVQLKHVDPSNPYKIRALFSAITVEHSNDCLAATMVDFAYSKNLIFLAEKLYETAKTLPNCTDKLYTYLLQKNINSEDNLTNTIRAIKTLIVKNPSEDSYPSLLADALFWDGSLEEARDTINSIPLTVKNRPSCESWFAFNDHDFSTAWNLYKVNIRGGNTYESNTTLDTENIHNMGIKVVADQGIGDQLMFITCLDDLIQLNPKELILKCDPRLHALINRSYPDISFTKEQSTAYQEIGLSSLPSVFRNKISSFQKNLNQFTPDSEKKKYWENRLCSVGKGIKVGFAWKGGTARDKRLASKKSFDLKTFEDFFNIPNTQWINLQYGDVANELSAFRENYSNVHYFQEIDPITEIENQLALIYNLDLVIQIDNSSVHFSGALGVKTWLLLGYPHDFRWFSNGINEQSSWYPSVKMIKKGREQTWQALVASLVPELTALAEDK